MYLGKKVVIKFVCRKLLKHNESFRTVINKSPGNYTELSIFSLLTNGTPLNQICTDSSLQNKDDSAQI